MHGDPFVRWAGGKEYLQGFSIKKRKESLPSCGINTGKKLGKHVFEPPFSPCLSRCTNEELSFSLHSHKKSPLVIRCI